jgi:DNA-binding response OmpR family regulator
MSKHVALVVEDDAATAEDFAEVLKSLNCEFIITANKADAVEAIKTRPFCFVLLDLQIRLDRAAIKDHSEHGRSFLKELRDGAHGTSAAKTPVVVVSGHAGDWETLADLMRHGGADDVLRKPAKGLEVSRAIRECLEKRGQTTHELCTKRMLESDASQSLVLAIPGFRSKQRTRVTLGARHADLPNATLRLLLALVVGKLEGRHVHKRDLGGRDDEGLKGPSDLRRDLRPALPDGVDGEWIVVNEYHGMYHLAYEVTIGHCAIEALVAIDDAAITKLARQIEQLRAKP